MTEQNQAKKQLIEQLKKVNMRLQILDMIEEKLLKMKKLAGRVIEEDLTEKEIQDINKQVQELVAEVDLMEEEIQDINNQVQELVEEVGLLDSEPTELS